VETPDVPLTAGKFVLRRRSRIQRCWHVGSAKIDKTLELIDSYQDKHQILQEAERLLR